MLQNADGITGRQGNVGTLHSRWFVEVGHLGQIACRWKTSYRQKLDVHVAATQKTRMGSPRGLHMFIKQ
jgi:hypothetical protein